MPLVDRPAAPIHWEAVGPEDAPPVLLVMGLAFSSRAWEGLPARLAERFRVITFDNRGTGRSTPLGGWGLFGITDLAEDAAAVIEAATKGRPADERSAHVFGISMGGMIAQELALRRPERVRTLALGCTFASFLTSAKPSMDVMKDLFLSTAMPSRDNHAKMARHLVSDDFLARERDRFIRWFRGAEPGGPRLAFSQLAAVQRHDTRARLGSLRTPTLVLTGDGDRLIPPKNSEQLASAIPTASLVTLRGAGHVFPLEREAETTSALTAHFAA
ncbi:alpha/beta hydrolase [Myxococcota bacterium]|nr:alpha/beta hydrolase [Myxococcota bacterium]